MKYDDMLRLMYEERCEFNNAVDAIIQKNGGRMMQRDAPAADPQKLKQQGGIFGKD